MARQAALVATLTMIARSDKREEMLEGLRSLVHPTRVKPGCVYCELHESVEVAGAFTYAEEWANSATFERHLRSEEYRRLLIVMELAAEQPDVQFRTITATRGMEAIHEARGG
jgi:quinol monooxygenase YgiN